MTSERWEHGSEFAWPDLAVQPESARYPWTGGQAVLCGSGRDALRAVVTHGMETRGWRRLWLPSFLCQEVVAAVRECGIELAAYQDEPTRPASTLPELSREHGHVALLVNAFGLRSPFASEVGADVIEDHTHDLVSRWAFESTAQFCVASLRKTLPVPDGGVLWSPAALPLPTAPVQTEERERAASRKTAAMLLKRYYLGGQPVAKAVYRRLAADGEAHIASGAIARASAMTEAMLPLFPLDRWTRVRRDNRRLLTDELSSAPWLRVLTPEEETATGFSVVLVTDTHERREQVRRALIERRIYPAVLWPLDRPVLALPDESVELSRRILSLHCDHRYGSDDMRRVARAVLAAG